MSLRTYSIIEHMMSHKALSLVLNLQPHSEFVVSLQTHRQKDRQTGKHILTFLALTTWGPYFVEVPFH